MAKLDWSLDTMHSEIGFSIRHMMISNVKGNFTDFTATCKADEAFKYAQVEFTAQVASLTTHNEQRDGHIKSPDFFDAEKFPTVHFVSHDFENTGEHSKITGDLTIRDVTKSETFDVEFGGIGTDPYGQTKAGFTISGKIKRSDYGLTWGAVTETGHVVLADDLKVLCEVQFVKPVGVTASQEAVHA